jgi:O-antigen ligase
VCALVVVLPFEATTPLVRLPGQALTSSEAALLTVFGLWAVTSAATAELPIVRTPLTGALLALLATWLLSTALAPAFAGNAARMTGRLGLAAGVYLLTVNGVRGWGSLRAVSLAASLAGFVLGAIVVLDYAGIEVVRQWLTTFRPFVAHVGAQVRASGVFQYPTITSMYLEVLFALSLPLLAMAVDKRQRLAALAIGVALITMSQAIVLTFTRAGLVTAAAAVAIVAACWYRARGHDRAVTALGIVAGVMVAQFATSRSVESLVLRFTTEGTRAWYSAAIDAPARIVVPTGGTSRVTLSVTNTGRVTWDSTLPQPFRLSYHWLTTDGQHVVSWEGRRTSFPRPVEPGERVTLDAEIGAPRQPGAYRVLWDVEHEKRLWFSTEPDAALAWSVAEVTGPSLGEPGPLTPLPAPLQRGTARPGRMQLWSGAARMLADHPVTGIGPDNFRLLHGSYLGVPDPDTRLHSNSTYVEVLASTGLLGGLAMALFGWVSARLLLAALETAQAPAAPPADAAPLAAGVVAAVVAIALHGLVDSFLSFTATYALFAIVFGLLVATVWPESRHAHRV